MQQTKNTGLHCIAFTPLYCNILHCTALCTMTNTILIYELAICVPDFIVFLLNPFSFIHTKFVSFSLSITCPTFYCTNFFHPIVAPRDKEGILNQNRPVRRTFHFNALHTNMLHPYSLNYKYFKCVQKS